MNNNLSISKNDHFRERYKVYVYSNNVRKANGIKDYGVLFIALLFMIIPIILVLTILGSRTNFANWYFIFAILFFWVYTIITMIIYTIYAQTITAGKMTSYVFENNGDIWKVCFSKGASSTKGLNFIENAQERMESVNEAKNVNKAINYVECAKMGNCSFNVWSGGSAKVTRYSRPTFIKEDKKFCYYKINNGKKLKIKKVYILH